MRELQLIGKRIVIAAVLSGFVGPTYAAERARSEEERIAPLVSKQNCWSIRPDAFTIARPPPAADRGARERKRSRAWGPAMALRRWAR